MKTTDDLRAAFDREFQQPYPAPPRAQLGVLALGVASVGYALAMTQVASIHVDVRVAAVPSKVRSLVGLATLRNVIVPVHDLGVALGHRRTAVAGRWLIVGHGDIPLGWAFESLDGQLQLEVPASGTLGRELEIDGRARRVLDLEEVARAA